MARGRAASEGWWWSGDLRLNHREGPQPSWALFAMTPDVMFQKDLNMAFLVIPHPIPFSSSWFTFWFQFRLGSRFEASPLCILAPCLNSYLALFTCLMTLGLIYPLDTTDTVPRPSTFGGPQIFSFKIRRKINRI